MALQGQCTYTKEYPTGEYKTETIEVGENGETQEVQTPIMEYRTEEYENAYVIVKQITQYQMYDNNGKTVAAHIHLAGYETAEHRDVDQEDFLFWDYVVLTNYNVEENIYSQCYDYLKTINGFENLVDC
tara:strand:+ start:519 stop:905 length:387 start_codon:yes stop_codon:yes gene_type:complete